MIVISGALVLVALILLVLGLTMTAIGFVHASIAVSLVSFVFLIIGILQRRGEPAPATGPAPEVTAGEPQEPEPADERTTAVPVPPAQRAGLPSRGSVRTRTAPPPAPVVEPDDDLDDFEEDVEDFEEEEEYVPAGSVLVVQGRPRYHIEGCRYLTGKAAEVVDVHEAREQGFSPCGVCKPDAVLEAQASAPVAAAAQDEGAEEELGEDEGAVYDDEVLDEETYDEDEAYEVAYEDEDDDEAVDEDEAYDAEAYDEETYEDDEASYDEDELPEEPLAEEEILDEEDARAGGVLEAEPEAEIEADLEPEPAPARAARGRRPAAPLADDDAVDEVPVTASRARREPATRAMPVPTTPTKPAPTTRRAAKAAPAASGPAQAGASDSGRAPAGPASRVATKRVPVKATRPAPGSAAARPAATPSGAVGTDRVVVIPDRGRFHRPTCRFVRNVEGTEELTRAQASQQGYAACGVCKP